MTDLERFRRSHLSEGQLADLQTTLRAANAEIDRLRAVAADAREAALREAEAACKDVACPDVATGNQQFDFGWAVACQQAVLAVRALMSEPIQPTRISNERRTT